MKSNRLIAVAALAVLPLAANAEVMLTNSDQVFAWKDASGARSVAEVRAEGLGNPSYVADYPHIGADASAPAAKTRAQVKRELAERPLPRVTA